MGMYQQVYMDVGTIWLLGSFNRAAIDDWFREMLSHGLGKRIMFGTDQMLWPDAIGMAIEVIESVKFLTEEQRRDIFYNNAARFLRLAASDGRVGPRLPAPLLEPTEPWSYADARDPRSRGHSSRAGDSSCSNCP